MATETKLSDLAMAVRYAFGTSQPEEIQSTLLGQFSTPSITDPEQMIEVAGQVGYGRRRDPERLQRGLTELLPLIASIRIGVRSFVYVEIRFKPEVGEQERERAEAIMNEIAGANVFSTEDDGALTCGWHEASY